MPTNKWTINRVVFLIAGILSMASVGVGYFFGMDIFYLLPAFFGFMQAVYALTGFCLMAMILSACGLKCEIKK